MKKNNGYEIDFVENTITVTKRFLKEAGVIGSAAYIELAQVRHDYPEYTIVERANRKSKKTYGDLTYKVMSEFIKAQEEENAPVVLAEFEQVKALSHAYAGKYAFVKTWFLKRYKDVFKQEETGEAAV